MPLPSSGPISLANIQTEFGGSNPIGLNEYYRGGGLVPASVTAVPASGGISLSNFYGTSNVPAGVVKLTSVNVINTVDYPANTASLSGIALERSGKLQAYANQFAGIWFEITPTDEWLNPESLADADNYECRATITSGSVSYSYFNFAYVAVTAWTRLGTGGETRYWWNENLSPGSTLTGTINIQIRNRTTLTVVASASIELRAVLNDTSGGGGIIP